MGTKVSVLVFDDDELIGQTIKNMGASYNLEVSYTPALDSFWKLLKSRKPDFIVLDLLMPQCDGVQVASDLAKLGVQSKIILTSGVNKRVLEAAARSASAQKLNVVGILQKPFSPKQFRRILDTKPSAQADTLSASTAFNANTTSFNTDVLAAKLEKAIADNEIEFALQPKVDCRTSRLKGFEVLARWHDYELGNIPPDSFISTAEQYNLIDKLTYYICAKSIAWFDQFIKSQRDTRGGYTDDITLSINISAASMTNSNILDEIESICDSHHISPKHITLELTETAAMEDPITTLDMLTRLRMKGFHLSIDDFGTGYSSMLQLVRLPFSELKIDKSFILTALQSHESNVVIKAMIELAHSLGLHIVAEGVEHEGVLNFLRELGCNEAQGYLISRPMEPSKVAAWLKSRQTSKEHKRVSVLKSYDILDTPREYRYDRLTRLAARLFKVPTSVVSFVDEHRQWFKATTGTALKETCRTDAFCHYTIEQNEPFIIHDTLLDIRFAENRLVTNAPFIRFYAGFPIYSPEHDALGAFCIMDIKPRRFSRNDMSMLQDLASMVEKEIAITTELTQDFLTGLLNRKTFENRLAELNHFCQKEGLSLSMLYLDIDCFKKVNDDLGHHAGDSVLTLFAQSLTETFRDSDLIARLGGDEFVVVMVDADTMNLDETLQRLDAALLLAASKKSLPPISYSYGIAVSSKESPLTSQQLYEEADRAMYIRKNIKKGR